MIFRVWDKINEEMIYPGSDNDEWYAVDQTGTLAKMHLLSVMGDEYKAEVMMDSQAVTMLSTGLMDENGKQIFEGDLVRYRIQDGGFSHPCEIIHENACFSLDGVEDDLYQWHGSVEIIGNKYEHSELLKEVAKS